MSKENKVIVVSYDQNLNRLGVIDVFRSLIWTRKYYECGTFELHAPLNTRNLQLLAENNILSKREFKDKNGHIVKTTSKESGIVEYMRGLLATATRTQNHWSLIWKSQAEI